MTAVSITVRTPVGFTFASGNYRIDDLMSGAYWGTKIGQPITLSYSFPASADNFTGSYGANEPQTGFAALNTDQQATFVSALTAWANVADVHFTLVPDSADSFGEIRAAFTTTKAVLDALAYAYTPRSTSWAGDVWLNGTANWTNLASGSYNFMALMHEIGHALGLSHPFGGSSAFGGSLPTAEDNRGNTIMAYDSASGSAGSGANFYRPRRCRTTSRPCSTCMAPTPPTILATTPTASPRAASITRPSGTPAAPTPSCGRPAPPPRPPLKAPP